MWKHQTLALAITALAIGCSGGDHEGLLLAPGDHKLAIEAQYHEGGRGIVLRANARNATATAELVDDRGHSLSKLADAVLANHQLPVAAMMANAKDLDGALRLGQHALRQLRDRLASDDLEAPAYKQLGQQTGKLRSALARTRLDLLQAWGSEVRKHLALTPDEHVKFFAILNKQAAQIATSGKGATTARSIATSHRSNDSELQALLGPERFTSYKLRREAWLAPAGDVGTELVP